MSDAIEKYKVATYRQILEKQIRVCRSFMDEARQENNVRGHRFADAQLRQTEYLLKKFDAVFDPQQSGSVAVRDDA